ncbi:RNA-binding region-containing protein 3 [Culicoides brevitarsis]|uniref:RNA-binding region-containing protein 3 n=1 Tax=Culicoides brevitarsis TaxID=469753 RepID=UPI00307BC8AD
MKLKIKNFPRRFSTEDRKNFAIHFGAINVQHEQDAIIAEFPSETQAERFLRGLHQKEILGTRLSIEYCTNSDQKPPLVATPNEFIMKYLSMNPGLNFNDPPPPYLRYKYPQPTREIIDSICVALESVPKFYTQVLHLMNKMNLPPPFTPSQVMKPQKSFSSVHCQTEISNVTRKRRIWSGDGVGSDESEMESDDEKEVSKEVCAPKRPRKANTVIKNPAKRFLQAQSYPKSTPKTESEVFESNLVQNRTISIKVPSELTPIKTEMPENVPKIAPKETSEPKNDSSVTKITRKDLADNRLSPEQLSILPVFKNYAPGEKSNKLYIKNLAKNVTTEDLKMIFSNFTVRNLDEIEIKLMQSGRMKGQAFVTFNTPYDDDVLEAGQDRMIDLALRETNGFLLKDKPMVVMYGKSS